VRKERAYILLAMSNTPNKVQRWLDLVAYLSGRRFPVPVEEIWAAVPAYAAAVDGSGREHEAVRRMFERDKDELRALGIPIETVTYSVNYGREEAQGYRLAKKNFHLPYVRLVAEARASEGERGTSEDAASARAPSDAFEVTEAEAGAALHGLEELARVPGLPLAAHARSAFRKLSFDLDPAAVGEPAVAYAEDPEAAAAREQLHLLSDAVRCRKRVRFHYRGITRDTDEDRETNPYGLLFQHGRWYLVAHDVVRDDVRMFRLGRMSALTPNTKSPRSPDFEIPAEFDLSEYVGRKAWEFGSDGTAPVDARVRFRFPRSLWAERNGHGTLVGEEADGAQVRSFEVRRSEPFLRWVLSLAGDARVEAPEPLREAFRALAAAVASGHADPEEGEPQDGDPEEGEPREGDREEGAS